MKLQITLPLKPFSSSNNFSTYISFLPLKKQNTLLLFQGIFQSGRSGNVGLSERHTPNLASVSAQGGHSVGQFRATWGPCSQAQAQETFSFGGLRLQCLWQKSVISSQLCFVISGIWCRPQSGHVMSLLISHDSCTDARSGVTKAERKYRPESNSGLSDVSVVFLPVFSLPVLFFLPSFLPSLPLVTPPSPSLLFGSI